MNDLTLHSQFKDIPPWEEKLVPNLIVSKANEHARNGKTNRIMDSITGESYDYESFDSLTRNIASALHKRGLRNGDVVVFLTYDVVKLQIFQTGVWRANGIVRASYPEDDEETILSRVEESRVGWIYCEPEAAEMCLSIASKIYWDVEVIVAGRAEGCTSIYDLMDDDGEEMPVMNRSGEDPVLILNTSGTTGLSKGAVLSHEALLWAICRCAFLPMSKKEPNLFITKGTHVTGCVFPLVSIVEGIEIIVMQTIKADYLFQAIHLHKPAFIFAFPTLLVALINHPDASNYDLSSLRVAASGGAPVTPAIQKIVMQLPNMERIVNSYGLTEVVPAITTLDIDDSDMNILNDLPENSSGKLFTGVSAQFRDLETGEILGPNQTGELCLKCNGIFTEYLNNPKATENAFVDGFFKTGDIGYYDENEFIFIVDRAKEIFKYFGNHVSPTEIENIINDHPAVGEVCVIGVSDPDGGGHVPRAVCVILEDVDCSTEEVAEFANSRLPDFKHLRGGVYFVKKLPKGKTGKVTRQLVEQLELE